ncbi:MAG: sugar transferase [Solirubrobacteraceae bacterium]|nr:sugar transferase [Solirubrobacteraceae bacterium]
MPAAAPSPGAPPIEPLYFRAPPVALQEALVEVPSAPVGADRRAAAVPLDARLPERRSDRRAGRPLPSLRRRRAVARLEGLAVLGALWLATSATVFAGTLLGLAVVQLRSSLKTRRRSVLIVGRAPFCRTVEAAARGARSVARSCVVSEHGVRALLPAMARGQEIVVEGRILSELRPELPDALLAGARVHVVPNGLSGAHVFEEPLFLAHRVIKRSLDIVLALVLLVLTAPLLLVAVAAIKLESKGPALFVRTRVGLGGRPFSLYKLRSMKPSEDEDLDYLKAVVLCSAPSGQGVFKPTHANRITRVGSVLRRYSIDELPQIINVLKGDMSIVGPRPPLLHELDVYDDVSMQRLRVRPGITGLAQINGRSSLAFDRIVSFDLEYCEHWTPWLDLGILARTPLVVLTARGAA